MAASANMVSTTPMARLRASVRPAGNERYLSAKRCMGSRARLLGPKAATLSPIAQLAHRMWGGRSAPSVAKCAPHQATGQARWRGGQMPRYFVSVSHGVDLYWALSILGSVFLTRGAAHRTRGHANLTRFREAGKSGETFGASCVLFMLQYLANGALPRQLGLSDARVKCLWGHPRRASPCKSTLWPTLSAFAGSR